MQLTVQQPDLSQMFGQDSLYSTLYGMQRQDQANQNQNQNLSQAQQDQQFQAQDQPINLQQLAANVGHTNALTGLTSAQIPGAAAESTMKQTAADVDSSIPLDTKRQAALSKIATGLTADKLKQHVDQAAVDLTATLPDGTPDVKKRNEAQMVIQTAPELQQKMMELRQQGANEAGVAHINQEGANARDAADNAAGRYNKNSSAYLMMKGFQGNYQQQAGAWTLKAMNDDESGDTKGAEEARNMATLARNADHDARSAAAYTNLAKSPDFTALGIAPAAAPAAVAPRIPGPVPTPTQEPSPTPSASPTNTGAPRPGSKVVHGGKTYMFKGGDPANQSNWEQQ